jgi:hypothetical protein
VIDPIPELGASIDRFIYKRDLFGRPVVETRGASMAYYRQRNRAILPMLESPPLPPGLIHIRSSDAVCDREQCYAVIGGQSMYFDDNHLSIPGAHRLARLILDAAPSAH